MSRPVIRIHNTETDEILDREMTDDEYNQFLFDKKRYEDLLLIEEKKDKAKNSALAKLAALGLTEEEIAAL